MPKNMPGYDLSNPLGELVTSPLELQPDPRTLSWSDVHNLALDVALRITKDWQHKHIVLYGIPSGGIHAAQAVATAISQTCEGMHKPIYPILADDPGPADFIIDARYAECAAYDGHEIYALLPLTPLSDPNKYTFPWERMKGEDKVEDNIVRLLQHIGEDPKREGLIETPARVLRSYAELFAGYKQDPASVFTAFEDGACDQMVILKGVEFASTCEHHMLPFIGTAHIAYVPNGKVVGISKLARLLDIYARRLQIQERLCQQVTQAIDEHLQPLGSACILQAKHLCMTCRGVGKQHSEMITSSISGVFQEPAPRAEFFSLIGK